MREIMMLKNCPGGQRILACEKRDLTLVLVYVTENQTRWAHQGGTAILSCKIVTYRQTVAFMTG